MKCPFCGSLENKVINSRLTTNETSIRRRRECLACAGRFTTYEYIEQTPILVVKRDGRRQAFDRQKLINGLLRACEKRPVSMDAIEHLVASVEKDLNNQMEPEVSSLRVGEMVLGRLRALDEVAYVRFASVYRQFRDVSEFRDEIQSLLAQEQAAAQAAQQAASQGAKGAAEEEAKAVKAEPAEHSAKEVAPAGKGSQSPGEAAS